MLCSNSVSEEGPSDWRLDGQYDSLVSPIPQLNKSRGCLVRGWQTCAKVFQPGDLVTPYWPVF